MKMDATEIKSAVLRDKNSDVYEALVAENGNVVICDIYNEEIERFETIEEAEKKYLIF